MYLSTHGQSGTDEVIASFIPDHLAKLLVRDELCKEGFETKQLGHRERVLYLNSHQQSKRHEDVRTDEL